MPELDAFERGLETALRSFAERGVAPVDAVEFAGRVSGRPRARGWPAVFEPAPRLAWVLVWTALLLAALLAGAVVGGWRLERRPAVVPPSPVPPATVVTAAADILATTKAEPLPAQAVCPPGSDPDAPGDVDQDRPTGGEMAFDRHAGVIVVLTPESQTWTYDVCTNTWQRMADAPIAGYWPLGWPARGRLVYDRDSDRTLAFTHGEALDEIWIYDLAADRWTKAFSFPATFPAVASGGGGTGNETFGAIFYHDTSGLVVVHDGADMWAYDVDTNTLAKVRQQPDPSLPAGSGLPQGRIAMAYDPPRDLVVAVVVPYLAANGAKPYPSTTVSNPPSATDRGHRPSTHGQTWTFDPGTGVWHKAAAEPTTDVIVCAYFSASSDCLPSPGRAVHDEASGLPLFFTRDGVPGRIDAYDAGADVWRTLHGPAVRETAPTWCDANPPVYDPLNHRIVCLAPAAVPDIFGWGAPFAGVWAFSSGTGESRWLLEPDDTPRCEVRTLAGAAGEGGAADGIGAEARFSEPHAIVPGASGSLYVTDAGNHTIRRVTPSGMVTTIAGEAGAPGLVDGPDGTARFDRPSGLAVDATGTLYVADTGNDAIRRVAPDGTVTTIAEGLGISPVGIAVLADGAVVTGGLRGNVLLRVAPDGTVSTLAGTRGQAGRADGSGAVARLGSVQDIQLIGSGNEVGNLAVIDTASDGTAGVLRIVTPDGTVSTPALDWAANGRPRAAWTGALPYLFAVGDAIVALDESAVSLTEPAALRAGRADEAGYRDGRTQSVRFRDPTGIARDDSGRFYIVDSGNDVIRTMACTP